MEGNGMGNNGIKQKGRAGEKQRMEREGRLNRSTAKFSVYKWLFLVQFDITEHSQTILTTNTR